MLAQARIWGGGGNRTIAPPKRLAAPGARGQNKEKEGREGGKRERRGGREEGKERGKEKGGERERERERREREKRER